MITKWAARRTSPTPIPCAGAKPLSQYRGCRYRLERKARMRFPGIGLGSALEHASADLIELDRLKQRAEIALAEPLIALALDQLEEDRADGRAGEDLQQHFVLRRRAVKQDPILLKTRGVLAMAGQSRRKRVVIGVRRVLEHHVALSHRLDRRVDVGRPQRDVLDALAAVVDQVFLDLALVVRALVDRDPDLAARRGHRLRLEAGELAFDVEIANLAEVEQPLVEARPFLHPAAVNVVREVIDVREPSA